MTAHHSSDYLTDLVRELCNVSGETEWVEFKENNVDPEMIGKNISALANSAALSGKASAYILWGIRDDDHAVVGTTFEPQRARRGNEELENWLLRLLEPKIDFRFFTVEIDSIPIVLLEIARPAHQPVNFSGSEYIRVGSYTKKLKDFPEKERALWRIFDQTPFEDSVAATHQRDDEVLKLLDYPAYFDLLDLPLPENRNAILSALADDNIIRRSKAGGWDVTNLGALLLARKLSDFGRLGRKAIRVIQYRGAGRTEAIKEREETKGYACGFGGLISYIDGLLPSNEIIGQVFRKTLPMFPSSAVRELVANALIHQDFSITGAGPMFEIFDDRIEITNPGEPLVATERFVDTPPKSRNEALASLMRRFGMCEERGSGVDRVVAQIELFQLPAPLFEAPNGFTRAVLFAHKPLARMNKEERMRACYLHACLKYVMREFLTNASLRKRFGVKDENKSTVSRYIREAIEAGLIKPYDPGASRRTMQYVPYWA